MLRRKTEDVRLKRIGACLALALAVAAPAVAQPAPRVEAAIGVARRDYTYRFDNDSSFNTEFLVPHFFEQRYERTSAELELRLRYRLLGQEMRTALTVAPDGEAFGSDFDTFFQPDGDVAMSGTAGDVRLAGLGIEQTIGLAARGRARIDALFAWRRDRADFLPADRVVTHTQPPSESREWITDREVTVSQTFEVGVEGSWQRRSADARWSIETSARIVPALRGRLLVQLPDKYPGRDLVFEAAGWSAGSRVAIARRLARIDAGVWLSIDRAGAYRQAARFSRGTVSAGGLIAFGSRP